MKRWLVLAFIVFGFVGFASASVVVHNYTIGNSYSPFESITGNINLTVVGENYDNMITSNDNDKIKLGDFLNANGASFNCSPPDCSNGYVASDGNTSKIFNIITQGRYAGFVLTGKDITIDNISFSIKSDFTEGSRVPLKINFFGKNNWEFTKFSNSLLPKNWGCYNDSFGKKDSLIGHSLYCEMISVRDSASLRIGAKVSGTGTSKLDMQVFPESGTGASWSCKFDPNSEDGCTINPGMGETFSSGTYQVCVGADALTKYRIYQENNGKTCGFAYEAGPYNSTNDYAIFAQTTKYANANSLDVDVGTKENIAAANNIIAEKYKGDCSNGCIFPVKFSGVSQNLEISNVQIAYRKNYEWNSENKFYDLTPIPPTVNFSGILDLELLNFSVSKTMNYTVSIGNQKLFTKAIRVLPSPIVLSMSPLRPPAGVPINFYTRIKFDGNESLTYKWNFGDGATATTNKPFISHTYVNLDNYTLSLGVSAGGNLTSKRSFHIKTISPAVAIDTSLDIKKSALKKISSTINSFPQWYMREILKDTKLADFQSTLDKLERERNNSFETQGLIKIAKELYALNIPVRINIEYMRTPEIIKKLSDINIYPIATIGGSVSGANNSEYARPIANWQLKNIESNLLKKKISVSYWNGKREGILSVYSFNIKSKYPDDSYFVINRPFGELYFKEDVGERKVGNYTVITLSGNSNKFFEFYYRGTSATSFFVSPRLGSIVVKSNIDTTCNFNGICEKQYGENPENCRSDCKPTTKAVIYVIMSVLSLLIIYTMLGIWYKRHYENYLFNDRKQLYNLLMYVTNARARGMSDAQIETGLISKGWSRERVRYIIKKSRGGRIGMYEIIPIEKIATFFRNRKARKNQEANMVATEDRQQIRRNINKSGFQRRI